MVSFSYITLFPDIIAHALGMGILGRASRRGLVSFKPLFLRDFAYDAHRSVDDRPYGGGVGMLLRPDILARAWRSVAEPGMRTILLTPQGRQLTQQVVADLYASTDRFVIVCGHYEGIDERFTEKFVDEEISLGPYVVSGGEFPALMLTDALVRLVPGVLGNEASVTEDCFQDGGLKCAQYTRPWDFEGVAPPEVLLSGDHKRIRAWRQANAQQRTQERC